MPTWPPVKNAHPSSLSGRREQQARQTQAAIKKLLEALDGYTLYRNRDEFEGVLNKALKKAELKLGAPVKKAILAALSERDPQADICTDKKGNPEPDAELRDSENVQLPAYISLPLPLKYDNETGHDQLLALGQRPLRGLLGRRGPAPCAGCLDRPQ